MEQLNEIETIAKTGKEFLSENGKKTKYKLLDFWIWSVSDLVSNATRGRFAEFIVGTAIGINPQNIRQEWDAFDLTTNNGIKIEVKASSYIQSWKQENFSKISFSIKPSIFWDTTTNTQGQELKRHADIYVFCHLKHKDQSTIDPLKMEQWDFYILSTFKLDNFSRTQKNISLTSLKKLTEPKPYNVLKEEINKAYLEQKNHLL